MEESKVVETGATFPPPGQKDGTIYLTPDLFAALDAYARQAAGRLVVVEAITSPFGCVRFMAEGVFDSRTGRYVRETNMIHLANRISLEAFRSCKSPELDWSAIPPAMIYPFVLLHELAHIRNGDLSLGWDQLDWDKDARRTHHFAREMRADREAWAAIFPESAFPLKPESPWSVKELEAALTLEAQGMMMPFSFTPLPLDPELIPCAHRKSGIPWAA